MFKRKEILAGVLMFALASSPAQVAVYIGEPESELHARLLRFLKYGLAGILPDWKQRLALRNELLSLEVTPEIIRAVEHHAGQTGSVTKGWKKFAKSRECPFRLSVRIRKKGPLPKSLIRTVRLDPVPARAWRGASGCVSVNVAGKILTIEKSRNAQSASKKS